MLSDNSKVTEITLWSDSCVPQNKNKVMSTALMLFLQNSPSVHSITQKFCESGHSEIQEIDNLHSQIEQITKHSEIYSPLGLVRLLCTTPRKKPLKLIQLRKDNMKDYQSKANQFQFSAIPLAKVKVLRYCSNNLMEVQYKTSFSEKDWLVVQIKPQSKLRFSKGGGRSQLTMPAKFTIEQKISKEK
ncbi:hypothetical protein Bpfe_024103, partial [Biomphalaria pfeifferi]